MIFHLYSIDKHEKKILYHDIERKKFNNVTYLEHYLAFQDFKVKGLSLALRHLPILILK